MDRAVVDKLRKLHTESTVLKVGSVIRENIAMADVRFVCAGGAAVLAEKLVLSTVSHFLKDIFVTYSVDQPGENVIISLPDFHPATVLNLVDFLYRGKTVLPARRLNDLVQLCVTLGMTALEFVVGEAKSEQHAAPVADADGGDGSSSSRKRRRSSTTTTSHSQGGPNRGRTKIKAEGSAGDAEDPVAYKKKTVWTCNFCSKPYNNMVNMKYHVVDFHLKDHIEEELEDRKECPDCSGTFSSVSVLRRHYAFVHKHFLKFCTEDDLRGTPEVGVDLGPYAP